jgi:ATP-binding cassette, subfamily B, bacterial
MSTTNLQALQRILAYARPHRLQLIIFTLVSLALIAVSLLQPWPMKILVDNVVGGKPLPDVFQVNAPPPPPDLPGDFPSYPRARYIGPQQLAGEINNHRFDRLWYETDDPGPQVVAWFRQNLTSAYQPIATINTGYGERYQLDPNRRVVAAEIFVDPHQATVFALDYIPTLNSIDTGESRPDRLLLLTLVALSTLLLYIVNGALGIWSTALDLHVGQRMAYRLRSDLFQHLQSLSLLYHEGTPIGDSIYRVTEDTYVASSLLFGGLTPLLSSLITLGAMLAILFTLDWQLTLIALLVLPFLYLSVRYYAACIAPSSERIKELESGITSIVSEVLGNMRVVQAFARERHEQQRFDRQSQETVRARIELTMRQTRFHYLVDLATVAGTAVVLWLGTYHILQGQLTLGELLIFLGYLAAVYGPLNAIGGTFTFMQEALISARRVCEVFDREPGIQDSPLATAVQHLRGDVRFEHVSFSYRDQQAALTDISFEACAGDVVGIVGLSGAGKTTLVSLLLRLFNPDSGTILVDGQDVRALQVKPLREQISVVLQEPVLFATSIRENIAYGKLDASDVEIITAAKRAGAHEFVMQLPEQYQSSIGERGAQLSMGQRQRIALSRAFLKNAPILILDEPTSAMDAQNEANLLDALDELMRGRTTFIVAHRFSTIRRANKILVLDQGRLVESGSHEELMARRGRYQQLYQLQMSAPTREKGVLVQLDGA